MLIAAFYINAGNASYLLYRSFLLVAHFCGLLRGGSFHSFLSITNREILIKTHKFEIYCWYLQLLQLPKWILAYHTNVCVCREWHARNKFTMILGKSEDYTNCKNTTTLNLQVRVTSELFCNKNLFSQICLFYSNIWIKFCSISVSYLRAQSKIMHHCSTDSEMIKPYYWTEPKTKIHFPISKYRQL